MHPNKKQLTTLTFPLIFSLLLIITTTRMMGGLEEAETAVSTNTITVTTFDDELNDDGDCSLREAVQAANMETAVDTCPAGSGTDTIILPAGTYNFTLGGSSEDNNIRGDLDLNSDIYLRGSGIESTVIDAKQLDRVLHIFDGATVEIDGVTLTNGKSPDGAVGASASFPFGHGENGGDGSHGGGIFNAGILTLTNSIVQNCRSGSGGEGGSGSSFSGFSANGGNGGTGGDGGGVYNSGELILYKTTINDVQTGFGGNGGITNGGQAGKGGNAGDGAGIFNASSGALSIINSTLSRNITGNGGDFLDMYDWGKTAGDGGMGSGIFNTGIMTITNSTVSSNRTGNGGDASYNLSLVGNGGDGGGVYNVGTATLEYVTISANSTGRKGENGTAGSDGVGGGVYAASGTLAYQNSIIAQNDSLVNTNDDCFGSLTSQGYNLVGSAVCSTIGTDIINNAPNLGTLSNNGTAAHTHLPLTGSPAIDVIPTSTNGCGDDDGEDQRGVKRPFANKCDIGAVETGYVFWDGGGSDTNWSTAENWILDTLPTPSSYVLIATGSKNVTLNTPITVTHLHITSGFGGTINQTANDLTVTEDFSQAGGGFAAGDGGMTFSGNFSYTVGSFIKNSGTVTFTGTTTQTLTGNLTFYNLIIDNSSSEQVDASTASLTVSNLLHIQDGTFKSASNFHHVMIDPDGELELTNDITVSGNWTNNGLVTHDGKHITFDGNAEQSLPGNQATEFHDVTISPGSTLALTHEEKLYAHGIFTNSGTLSQTQLVDTINSPVEFSHIWDSAGHNSLKYQGMVITPTTSSMGNVMVSVSGHQDCTSIPGEAVQRCFDISSTSTNDANAALTFYFLPAERSGNDCNILSVYRQNGDKWDELTPTNRQCTIAPYSVTIEGVNTFSRFVLKNEGSASGPNEPPVASAGPNQEVYVNKSITLDGSGSSDADGDLPLTYQWTQTGGTTVVLSGETAVSPAFTAPNNPTTITFTLTVTDSRGLVSTSSDEVVITVANYRLYLPLITEKP